MQATQVLRQEHRVIEQGVAVLSELARRLRQGQPVDRSQVAAILDFLVHFADGCHHAKEEGSLFPRLERGGIPRSGGPIGVMLHEHEHGRQLISTMQQALANWDEESRRQEFWEAAEQYVTLLRQHIWKEDNVLFMLAERVLAPTDDEAICSEFARHENERMGPGRHEYYHRLHEELARALGVSSVATAEETAPITGTGCGCAHAEHYHHLAGQPSQHEKSNRS